MEKYSRIKALISLDAIRYNFEQMKKNIKEGTKIIAVIKADAYGHGAVPIARMLEEFDYIWGFAAATAQEALQLRRAGITRPILILGLVFEEYYKELAENDVRMAVCDYETARKFNKAAEEAGKKGLIHLAADTGMTRDKKTEKRVWRKSAELQLFPMWKLKVYLLILQEQMNTTAPRQWFS